MSHDLNVMDGELPLVGDQVRYTGEPLFRVRTGDVGRVLSVDPKDEFGIRVDFGVGRILNIRSDEWEQR